MIYNINVAIPNSEIGQKIKQHTQDVYKEIYNANVNPNPDEFIYLEKDEEIFASFGVTYRENKKLFSECYLDIPLEKEEHACGDLVSSEVGSFIAVKGGFGVQLYKLLPYILREKYIFHALVTLTSKVKILFDRLHFNTTYLNDAAEDRVPDKNIWGSFYKSCPKTFVMNVQKSCSDISLVDYAIKLNIQIKGLGKDLEQKSLPHLCNVASFGNIEASYHEITYQRSQENFQILQTNHERT